MPGISGPAAWTASNRPEDVDSASHVFDHFFFGCPCGTELFPPPSSRALSAGLGLWGSSGVSTARPNGADKWQPP